MSDDLIELIRATARPMDAVATGESPRLQRLSSIAAVIFDIYGTLMISGSGDVGTAATTDAPTAIRASLASLQVETDRLPADVGLEAAIRREHQRKRSQGIDYPEVDIREVWRDVLSALVRQRELPDTALRCDLTRLAVEYERRVNPVWPMPTARACIDALCGNRVLGIVSNAQFFTPMLFPALMMQDLDQMGFARQVQIFSYEHGIAKPSPEIFRMPLEQLRIQGISARETLYVGNDMLNDIATASRLGMKTALFAGDSRSLRWREGDPRVAGCTPDVLITELIQLTDCLS